MTGTRVTERVVRVGSRGSALARHQAEQVAAALRRALPGVEVRLREVTTSGDRERDVPLSLIGGKGLFLKELEEELLAGGVDCAVHSLKDVPGTLPEGCTLAALPSRADPRDVLVLPASQGPLSGSGGELLGDLPPGARVGTGSLRRRTQLLALRPDLDVVSIRGNVDTRLAKLDAGTVDALVLARAGLERLGRVERATATFEPHEMLPAVGQGIIAVEARQADLDTDGRDADLLRVLRGALDDPTLRCVATAERAFLRAVAGDCNVPLAAWAQLKEGRLELEGLVGDADGNLVRGHVAEAVGEVEVTPGREPGAGAPEGGAVADRGEVLARAEVLGARLGRQLLERGGRELLERVDPERAFGPGGEGP